MGIDGPLSVEGEVDHSSTEAAWRRTMAPSQECRGGNCRLLYSLKRGDPM